MPARMQKKEEPLRVFSWNVNGLRAAEKKGFIKWLDQSNADIVGLQEVRANESQLSDQLRYPAAYHSHFVSAERKGYSGVGLFSRDCPSQVESKLAHTEIDAEGRLQLCSFGDMLVANGYFPNGNGKQRDNSRIPFKLEFYRLLRQRLQPQLEADKPVIVMGDFNTAHHAIDIARPKQNKDTSGFRTEEREAFQEWIDAGWVDSFRQLNQEPEHYTWWSQRSGVREKNIGWRIDYILLSPAAAVHLETASIYPKVVGSDHCPIGVTLNRKVLQNQRS